MNQGCFVGLFRSISTKQLCTKESKQEKKEIKRRYYHTDR
jgi:hypothetical protein